MAMAMKMTDSEGMEGNWSSVVERLGGGGGGVGLRMGRILR